MTSTISASSFSSITGKATRSANSYQSVLAVITRMAASYQSISRKTAQSANSYRRFTKEQRVIYATNTVTGVVANLGTLEDPATTLTDVPLADGSYLIEVRSSLNFWDETRSRISFPVIITAGVVESVGLPNIINLRAVITSGITLLKWSIPEISSITGLQFGIWEDTSPSVVTSGPPDYTVELSPNVGIYQSLVAVQTVNMYYAVASFSSTDQGAVSEILSSWDSTPPISPPQQNIYS